MNEERLPVLIAGSGQLGSRYLQGLIGCVNRLQGRAQYQSKRTAPLVDSILSTGARDLSNLPTSTRPHRILLGGLLKHWKATPSEENESVPVT